MIKQDYHYSKEQLAQALTSGLADTLNQRYLHLLTHTCKKQPTLRDRSRDSSVNYFVDGQFCELQICTRRAFELQIGTLSFVHASNGLHHVLKSTHY